jgi:hypothetical protein
MRRRNGPVVWIVSVVALLALLLLLPACNDDSDEQPVPTRAALGEACFPATAGLPVTTPPSVLVPPAPVPGQPPPKAPIRLPPSTCADGLTCLGYGGYGGRAPDSICVSAAIPLAEQGADCTTLSFADYNYLRDRDFKVTVCAPDLSCELESFGHVICMRVIRGGSCASPSVRCEWPDLHCDEDTKMCSGPAGDGASCFFNADCITSHFYCNHATDRCTPRKPLGSICEESSECVEPLLCRARTCVEEKQ